MKLELNKYEDIIKRHTQNNIEQCYKEYMSNTENIDIYSFVTSYNKYYKLIINNEFDSKDIIEFTCKQHSWYKTKKINSFVTNKLLNYIQDLYDLNLTINKTLTILATLLYQNGNLSIFKEVDDKFVCKRNNICRTTLLGILAIFKRCGILTDLKWICNRPYIKLDYKWLRSDNLVKHIYKRSRYCNMKLYNKLTRHNDLRYKPYNYDRLCREQREIIMGLIWYYNLFSSERSFTKKHIRYDGKDNNILYVQIPYHLIQYATGLSLQQIKSYIIKLCRSSNYISRHTKQYVNSTINNEVMTYNYYNPELYKQCPLKAINFNVEGNIKYEDNNLIISDCSAILYMDTFTHTKLYNNILKDEMLYKSIIAKGLYYLKCTNYTYIDKQGLSEYEYNQLLLNNPLYINDLVIKTMHNSFCSTLIDMKLRHKCKKALMFVKKHKPKFKNEARTSKDIRIKFKETTIYEYSTKYLFNCIKCLHKIVNANNGIQITCRPVDLKYYCDIANKLINNVKEVIKYFKDRNEYITQIKPFIDKYDMWSYIL